MARLVRSAGLLTLNAAARQLNIHPTTLRRWADRGEVPSFLTPGGHRRFLASDLQSFVSGRRIQGAPPQDDLGTVWADKAMKDTRSELAAHRRDAIFERFTAVEREQFRGLGQRLMGLLLRHVARDVDDEEILTETKRLGEEYGRGLVRAGLTLTEAVAATMFFRDTIVESTLHLPDTVRVKSEQNMRLLRRLTGFMNVIQLAIATTYDSEATPAA
jgi:excisionase family DNA binding protein